MMHLQKDVSRFNQIMDELSDRLSVEDEEKVYRVFKSFLHTLRDLISIEESIQLIAQLPFLLKALYVDNWSLSKDKKGKPGDIEEFIDKVRQHHFTTMEYDFPNEAESENMCRIMFDYLGELISEGEMKEINSVLPKKIRNFFTESIITF